MIETNRLFLRPYKPEDAEIFFKKIHTNYEHLQDYFLMLLKTNKSKTQVEQYFLQKQYEAEEKKGFAFGIFLKNNDELIGHVSVREIDWRVPKGELAYYIFKEFTGQKYSIEALEAFRDWCFTKHHFCRLYMKIAPDNFASIHTAEKCHSIFEGLLKHDYRKKEETLIDMNIYGYTGAE